MNRFHHRILDFFLLFTIGISFLLWFWWLVPYNPLEIESPLIVLNEDKTVVAGEFLRYSCVFQKNTPIKPTIHRRLIDGIVYSFPNSRPTNPVGSNNLVCSLEIPASIPAGDYILDTSACYQMNPIREVCVDYQTEEFKII